MAAEAQGCNLIQLSPFEIHFSQTRIRSEFQDGRPLQGALDEIEAETQQGDQGEEDFVLLKPPFPRIEVTRWRCKLREKDGAPRLDPDSGLELYSQEEQWFSFDNRRLCCLQRAAASHWPQKVRCEVVEIPPTLARTRELRKFDTRTGGLSVLVGRREEENLDSWCWRTAVGLPKEEQPETGVVMPGLRSRGSRTSDGSGGRGPARRPRNRQSYEDDNEEVEEVQSHYSMRDILSSALLFAIIYLALRMLFIVFRKHRQSPTAVGNDDGNASSL
eukprot:gb/GFBE01003074.1/.p1 GENE.gb/GFBE01003074.1/~~gb/GFBE01003074.1/.p1  ORF type:complete len:274 (+),score=35.55 gb/GFBE01003074.1/:1-822(+)